MFSIPLSKSIREMNLSSLLEKQSQARNDKTDDHKEYVPVYEVISKIINIKEIIKNLSNESSS